MKRKTLRNLIQQEVEQISETILGESFRGFRLAMFKRLSDRTKMIEYAKKYLPFLNSGSTRTVFGLGSGKVLKIAIDEYGNDQNETEIEVFTGNKDISNYITKIYDHDEKNNWIIAEAVKIIGENSELSSQIAFPKDFFEIFVDLALDEDTYEETLAELFSLEEIFRNVELNSLEEKLLKSAFIVTRHNVFDIAHPLQWGVTMDGRVVAADYGLQ